jgi:HlyD family secretion protein
MNVKQKSSFSSKVPLFVGFLTMVLLITGFVTWGVRANIAGAVVAPGRIVVDKNRQVVQHPDGGVVEEILVEEGDVVEEGDILVKLDPSQLKSQLTLVEGQLFELIARRGLLEAERDGLEKIVFDPILKENSEQFPAIVPLTEGQVQLFEARRETLVKQIEQLRNRQTQLNNQVQGIDAQKTAIGQQKALIKDELSSQEILLEKGLAQASRVLALQREEARLSGTMGDLVARRAQALDAIAQLEIEELQLTTTRREEAISRLRDVEYNERGLAEERRSLRQQLERLDIRAPISGVVYDMRVYGRKSVIRPAEPVLNLVPQDRPLIIEARVNPLHVDQIYLKQQVILRVSAFDMRSTPDLFGKVTQISPDAFVDEQTGDSWYRVEIVLPEEELKKLSDGQILIPGMPVDSFIRTEDHSPVAYLMVPLTRYFDKAFRDG